MECTSHIQVTLKPHSSNSSMAIPEITQITLNGQRLRCTTATLKFDANGINSVILEIPMVLVDFIIAESEKDDEKE